MSAGQPVCWSVSLSLCTRWQALLEHGAKVNWQNSNHYTALMRGALRGHEDIVEVLLAKGADTSLTNSRRSTAEQLALNKGHDGIARLIRLHSGH